MSIENDSNNIITEIRLLKKDLFEIINQRLETFKVELLQMFDTKLKFVQTNIEEYIFKVSKRVDSHELRIREAENKIEKQELKLEEAIHELIEADNKKTFRWIKIIAIIYMVINILLVAGTVFFVKYFR